MTETSNARGASAVATPDVEPWHTRDVADVEHRLGTGPRGLPSQVAADRLRLDGPNEVAGRDDGSLWTLAIHQLRDPLIYALLAAAAVTLALRDVTDTIVILAVVAINAGIGFVQEVRARTAMRALARLAAPVAHVIRDGAAREIPSRDLVRGDLVAIASGARVPADLRLTRTHGLAIDESLLTGESGVVEKSAVRLADAALVPGDRTNVAFAGTTIARGRGRGIVVRTGAATELGRIAHAVHALGRTATPLQESFARFGRRVGLIILGLTVLALGIGLARGMPPADIFLTAVAMAVSAIPEGLPVVLTVTLAVGVRRMARRRAIIRALPAVETLGSTTVIGTDKTGTLTKNEMTVRAIWTGGETYEVTGIGYAGDGDIRHAGIAIDIAGVPSLRATLETSVLASETGSSGTDAEGALSDPTELALIAAAVKGGIDPRRLREAHAELDLVPFESERRYMVSLRAHPVSAPAPLVEHLKGAPEVVLARCDRQQMRSGPVPLDRASVLAAADAMAASGLRVLAAAWRPARGRAITRSAHGSDDHFILAGLVGMEDPVRPEAITAVRDAHAAGIRVLMLTGDHVGTARAVGARLGLGERAVVGHEIGAMPDEALDAALRDTNLFARVAPEHKLRIVQRLEAAQEVVAVTGDGANDAPALRAAHLGIAMGASGSDVAREAADMVLADDNFATITAAVEEGRIVFANIRKATFFLLSTAAGEIVSILVALLAGWPIPFTAAQILWINLVTDSLQVMALSVEAGEPGLLHRGPRPRGEGVLTPALFARLGLVGAVLTATTMAAFWWTMRATGDLRLARTVALTQMVVLQSYHVFNCRSLDRSVFRMNPLGNGFLIVSMLAVACAQVAALHWGPLQRVLATVALDGRQWFVVLAAGTVVVLGGEVDKWVHRRTHRPLG